MLVGDIVASNACLFPNKRGIIDERVSLTWNQFNDRVNRLANAMLGLGLKQGDRVAIICENCHEHAEFLFAIAKSGLIGSPINYRLTPEQIIRILNDCAPKVLFVQNKFAEVTEQIQRGVKSIDTFVGIGDGHGYAYDYESLLSQHSPVEPVAEVDEEDFFLVGYTTGTTGTSKGVILSHRNVMSGVVASSQAVGTTVTRNDMALEWAAFYTIAGIARLLSSSFVGATVVICNFSARSFVELIERERVSFMRLQPATFKMVKEYLETSDRKYDLSSLRAMGTPGGQNLSMAEMKEMLDYFEIPYSNAWKAYGMFESSSAVVYFVSENVAAALSPGATEKDKKRFESLGKPVMGVKLRIVDENDKDVPPGQTGEILLKSDSIMKGYWNKPELTSQVLRGGWYHTSDLGRLDEDGYLYYEGRKDFVIKSGGFLVGPAEVENVILRHPAVAEVAVIGVPDEMWGQAVKAVVCLKPGQHATEEEIKEHCRQCLANYQVPKSVSFMEKLPREGVYGKVNIKELLKAYSRR